LTQNCSDWKVSRIFSSWMVWIISFSRNIG